MKYYVYTLAYPDGQVFYVGQGQGNRIDQHEYEARSGKRISNQEKVDIIRKIWAGGGEVVKEKVFETDEYYEVLDMEKEFIEYYGPSNIVNKTRGGEGTIGYKYTPAQRQARSADQVARWASRSIEEKEAAFTRKVDNWLVGLRGLEKWVEDRKEPAFDRYSRTKLYPTWWEEQECEYVEEEYDAS